MAKWAKHLAAGSECPTFAKDKLTFLNMRFCPYAQRTQLVLDAKKIPYENFNVNVARKPQWFLDKNPLGKVPTIQINDAIYYESLPVCDYLDEAYPGRKLLPDTPEERVKDKMALTHYDMAIFPGLAPYIPLLRRETLEEKEEVLNKFQNAMKYFELELESRGTTFFGGKEHPKMLDYMIWPWLERADIVPLIDRSLELLPKSNFPLLNVWMSAMKEDEAVKGYLLDPETHLKFLTLYTEKKFTYDF